VHVRFPHDLYGRLRFSAVGHGRSVHGELLWLLDRGLLDYGVVEGTVGEEVRREDARVDRPVSVATVGGWEPAVVADRMSSRASSCVVASRHVVGRRCPVCEETS
jgi:hypothetical protein